MDELDNWSSSIRFTIKAFTDKDAPTNEYNKETVLHKKWMFRLNVASDCEADPIIHQYPAAYLGQNPGAPDSYLEEAYVNYCVKLNDREAIDRRKAGHLAFVSFKFRPAKAQTEGILYDPNDLDRKFQYI